MKWNWEWTLAAATALGAVSVIGGYFARDAYVASRCLRWETYPGSCCAQACHRYEQRENSLVCVKWECERRVCVEAKR